MSVCNFREMSSLIFDGAQFGSYAEFQSALAEYCRQNAVNGIPLHFTRQGSTLLKADTFKNTTIDQETIKKFVYQKMALVCSHRKLSKGGEVNCQGRISFRYDKDKKLILVSSYYGQHTNHPLQSVSIYSNGGASVSPRNKQLQTIFELVKKLPDDALGPVQQACETILQEWGNDNAGVTIAICPTVF